MRIYRALLHLYPAAFRGEYGEEMCAVFAARKQQTSSPLSALVLWISTIIDTLFNAVAAHWDLLRQDLRYTARTVSHAPGFAITVILVAGLGIGATTAVFTVTDQALIRALPFPESNRLVKLWESPPGYSEMELSPLNYLDWKRMSTSFESMGAYSGLAANLVGEGEPEHLEGARVTADLFPTLGVKPALGRLFTAEDEREGATGTLLLSHVLWQTMFGGDPGVLGRRVLLDNEPHVIIGVMPRDFYFPWRDVALWRPERWSPANLGDRNNNYLDVVARLKPGVSLEQARQEMRVIAARLEEEYPKENARTTATVNLLRDQVSRRSRLLLTALFGAALCVLLIACTNLANLLLARAMSRRKELAVRSSLGAGRERLMRQLLTETLVLAVLGGMLGILAAHWVLPLLTKLTPLSMPIAEPSIDLRVLAFAVLVTGLTGLGFGVIPAMRACRGAAADGLREGSRGGIGGRKERVRSALVVVQVAASVILLISSGLLIRALWRLQATDPGFRAEGALTLRTALPMPKYEMTARREQFYTRVLAEVRELPGVTSAGYISFLPMGSSRGGIWPVSIGGELVDRAENQTASLRFVTPGFFASLGIPVKLGRDVSESDTAQALFVAVVSESFVQRYWPGENPLGRRFNFGFADRTIVGVVGNVRVRGLERNSEPQVYLPYKQVGDGGLVRYAPKDLVLRASGDPATLTPAVRRIIQSADPEQPVSDVRLMTDIVAADTASRTTQVRVLGAFALIAFLLAGIGIHGLLSFTVSNRAQEIGVRIALGARPGNILSMVLRSSLILAVAGVVVGAALGYAAGRAMEALLVGVAPGDAATFVAAIALAFTMTMAGSLLPALRAVRVDPTKVIRAE